MSQFFYARNCEILCLRVTQPLSKFRNSYLMEVVVHLRVAMAFAHRIMSSDILPIFLPLEEWVGQNGSILHLKIVGCLPRFQQI